MRLASLNLPSNYERRLRNEVGSRAWSAMLAENGIRTGANMEQIRVERLLNVADRAAEARRRREEEALCAL